MKIDFDKIIANLLYEDKSGAPYTKAFTKACMREACRRVLDEAIRSFPSHEHPEITKAIQSIKEEL